MFISTPNYKLQNGINVSFWRVGNLVVDSLNNIVNVEVLGYMTPQHYSQNRKNGILERRSTQVKSDWEQVLSYIQSPSELEEFVFYIALKSFKEDHILLTNEGTPIDESLFETKYNILIE